MINKNKILFALLIVATISVFFLNAKRYLIDREFQVYMHIPCSEEGRCFLVQDAIDDEIFNDEPYLKMYRNNKEVEFCIESGICDVFTCKDGEEDCEITECSEETLEDGEICV